MDTTAKRAHYLRLAGGLLYSEADRLAGLTRGQSWQTEHRSGEASVPVLRALSELYGATVGWIGNAEGKPPSVSAIKRAVTAARDRVEGANGTHS